jgi:lipoate-protein ligase B
MGRELEKRWICIEASAMDYREAWDLQKQLVGARKEKVLEQDVVLFVEHPPVFTLGRNCGLNNLTVKQDYLEASGVSVIRVERGGDITFHGPGQLVVYPIIDLRSAKLSVGKHVELLEEVMIRTAAAWDVRAERNAANRGIWVGRRKLGSLGIAVRHGISFHGMAFNVNVSLEPFGWINPCGLQGVSMTSLARELSKDITMDQARATMKHAVETTYGVRLVTTSLSELERLTLSGSIGHRPTRTGTDGSAEGRQKNEANRQSSTGDAYAPSAEPAGVRSLQVGVGLWSNQKNGHQRHNLPD